MAEPLASAPVVIKVGGSLYDWAGLRSGLSEWLKGIDQPLLVPGGGPGADCIRSFDETHQLGEEAAHWMALEALRLNAHLLAALLRELRPRIVARTAECSVCWQQFRLPIMDCHAFALADEGRTDRLPHSWRVTSDSVAARVADVMAARRLVLMKSVSLPDGVDYVTASKRGLVDEHFPHAVGSTRRFDISWVNLRAWQPRRAT